MDHLELEMSAEADISNLHGFILHVREQASY